MSPIRMNLWSLTLLPGEPVPIYVRRDFEITNAALGEELRSTDGRSVVKVTHNPIPPSAFNDSDSEFDSEDEDDDEEDEEEDDEEEIAKEDGEGSEDDDEDMDSDDEDFDDDIMEETSVMCSLTAGKIEQATLNLTFVEGEVIIFEVTGENAVHLMGNYIDQFPDVDSDSEYDHEHDDYSDLSLDDEDEFDVEEFDEEEVTVPTAQITEIEEPKPKAQKKKAIAAAPVAESPAPNKRKAEEIESPAAKTEQLSKTQKKKLAKKAKLEADGAAPAAAAPAPKEKESKKKTLPSGLVIEDVTVGTGPVAKNGKRLGMRYIGKLENGKQFDANTGGKPFSFVLGRGEVIAGWDQGLAGMAVGGERRLTIPAKLAYGKQKIPGIPANSTLKFDVKLVSVN